MEHPFLRQWLVIGLILGMFATLAAYDLHYEYRRIESSAEERLRAQARIIDDNLASKLRTADITLTGVVNDIPVWRRKSVDQASIIRRLTAMSNALPGIRSISILDKTGSVVISNRPELIGQPLSGRSYFQLAKAETNAGKLYVSPPFTAVTNNYIIALSRTVLDENGQFDGIVVAGLDADYFSTLLTSVLYAPDMWSAVMHTDGGLFVIVPQRNDINKVQLLKPTTPFQQHQKSQQKESTQRGWSELSQDKRIVAFRTIQPPELKMDKALIVAISRNEKVILHEWYEGAFALGSAFLIVCALTIGLQLYYQRSQLKFELQTHSAQVAMRSAESRFATAFNEAPIGMALTNLKGQFLQANHALGAMLGYSAEELLHKTFQELTHTDDLSTDLSLLQELLDGKRENYQLEKRYLHKDGRTVWALLSVSAVRNQSDEISYLIKQIQDISLLKEQARQLEQLAHYDKLTGLPNRTLLNDRMQQAIAQAHRTHQMLAVGFLDLDGFKNINDTCGHAAGDEVLIATATRLLDCVRGEDTITRLGGDEFVFLLTHIETQEECSNAVERMLAEIEKPIQLSNGKQVEISASFGISLYPQDSNNPETLLRHADRAMYAAKYAGGHGHHFFANPSETAKN
jgi:diguanylate cyclase (GGDEF)-like protein/PAS domain S-box-containing protein